MAAFSAVNASLPTPADGRAGSEQTPSTPRPDAPDADLPSHDVNVGSSPSTPTRHSFAGILGQRPLPDDPLTPSQTHELPQDSESVISRSGGSQRSVQSPPLDSQDVEMGEGDDAEDGGDDDGSDNESVTSESQRPSKKKKGQRFFCTGFPPCQLSFTRSEHLARHIRKHTGERPFQCHCSRRFSRLDNLRQHAQTVHVNEEIPGDSLAATSTRFQRQIRTDRVRPPNRSRASTMGSQGPPHSRGHSRNVSTSSVTSTASSVNLAEESRRRPPPLAMANDPNARARISIDTYNIGLGGNSGHQYHFYNQSPTGYGTPTSFANPSSPRFQSGMISPVSTISQSSLSRSSLYNGARAPARRLSVPSGNPYQAHNATYPPAHYIPLPSGASSVMSPDSSGFASPASSIFSHGRRDSETETEYRRRTWHPSSGSQYAQRPATSGLSYYQTPDEPRPTVAQPPVAASQMTRLPGIESFDHAPPSSARQQPSPMMVDVHPRPESSGHASDAGLHQGLTRLDITSANASNEGQWQSYQAATQNQPAHFAPQAPPPSQQYVHSHHLSMPEPPTTPRKNKRNAWYGGPIAPSANGFLSHRPSPEDSGSSDGAPTPSTSQGLEYHPVIASPNGLSEPYPPGAPLTDAQKVYYATAHSKPDPIRADSGYQTYGHHHQHHPHHPPSAPPTYTLQSGHDPRLVQASYEPAFTKLDALVAVATNESNRAVEHRS